MVGGSREGREGLEPNESATKEVVLSKEERTGSVSDPKGQTEVLIC